MTPCETKGHKLQVIITNKQHAEVAPFGLKEVSVLNTEIYHGSICIRCGQVFDRKEG